MEQHFVLYYFLSDLFHQILFYFGGVVAMGILLWEKWKNKPIQWRWVGAFFLFCLFVACFQSFVDEHHNSQQLIDEKAHLTSENSQLVSKLDHKQTEVDYLRDHQHIQITETGVVDPRISTILATLNQEQQSLKTGPVKSLRSGLVDVSREMLTAFASEKVKEDETEQEIEKASFTPFIRTPTPDQLLAMRAKWAETNQKKTAAWMQMDSKLRTQMMTNYGPRAIALLEQLQMLGEPQTGISEKDIERATVDCTVTSAGSAYWQTQECAQDLSVIVQKMH